MENNRPMHVPDSEDLSCYFLFNPEVLCFELEYIVYGPVQPHVEELERELLRQRQEAFIHRKGA